MNSGTDINTAHTPVPVAGRPTGVRRTVGMLILALLGALALLAFAGCGSDDDEGGPLTRAEKQYIQMMKEHQKTIRKRDVQLTTGLLVSKQRYPQGGLPTELMDATQGVLNARRGLIRVAGKRECPSERIYKLCRLWSDTLNAQYRWDDAVINFLNEPYTDTSFNPVIKAGRKQARLWRQCRREIRKLQREARASTK